MSSFFEIEQSQSVNFQKYIEAWNNEVMGFGALEGEPRKQGLQSLSDQVTNLWRSFNLERTSLSKHYMEVPASLRAYLAAFLMPNIQRIYYLMTLPESKVALKRLLKDNPDVLRIVDFGAGPLSASVGVLAALERTAAEFDIMLPHKIEFIAIERSERAYEAGLNLFQQSLIQTTTRVEVNRFSSPEKIPSEIHIAVAANVFNEIPLKHHVVTAQKIIQKMVHRGICLLVEPAQDVHAKNLHVLRDELLSAPLDQNITVGILGPCQHAKACPLSARSDRKDWCWFSTHWKRPDLLLELDQSTNLHHGELNFSYVMFEKGNSSEANPRYFARVVSAPMRVDDENSEAQERALSYAKANLVTENEPVLEGMIQAGIGIAKSLLCTTEGTLQSVFYNDKDSVERFKRGNGVISETHAAVRSKERFHFPVRYAATPKVYVADAKTLDKSVDIADEIKKID